MYLKKISKGVVYNGVQRTSNYFGKSNWAADALFDGCMDELKIFDRGLSQAEIQVEMNALRPIHQLMILAERT